MHAPLNPALRALRDFRRRLQDVRADTNAGPAGRCADWSSAAARDLRRHVGAPLVPALCRLVADSLDVVAVRIENVSAVIVGVIGGTNAWCAIVESAGVECRRVEGIDLTAAVSGQGDVQPPP